MLLKPFLFERKYDILDGQAESLPIFSKDNGESMEKLMFSAPCHFGLESVLSGELKRMGAEEVRAFDGRVEFSGGFDILARANINLRTAERVLIKLAEFPARSFEELFQGVKKLPLEEFIGKNDAFPVKGYCLHSVLHSIPDCQKIIKKAAVERLKEKYGLNWFEETGAVHQLQFSLLKDQAAIYLDTSGPGLHKRGYRKNANEAPIKETLAAGILDFARIRKDSVFYDPFCGSGTFLVEAALKALNIPVGMNRKFSAQYWDQIPQKVWREERMRGIEMIRKDASFIAYGSDIDMAAVELSLQNAHKAGVAKQVRVRQRDVKEFSPREEGAVIAANPPYGERLLDRQRARELYAQMGKSFFSRGKQNCYIISPDEEFESFFGQKAVKRRKLYNGMLKCTLYMYY